MIRLTRRRGDTAAARSTTGIALLLACALAVAQEPPAGRDGEWLITFGGAAADVLRAMHVQPNGDIWLAGSYAHQLRVGADLELKSAGSEDGFVVVFGADRQPRWAATFGSPGLDTATSLAVAGETALVTGQVAEPARFGNIGVKPGGMTDAIVAALDLDGQWRWARALGGEFGDAAGQVHAAGDGFVVTASIQRTATFADEWVSAGRHDVALLGLNEAGEIAWHRRFGGPRRDFVSGLQQLKGGQIVLAGQFEGPASFGELTLEAAEPDQFVASLDSRGEPQWARRLYSPAPDGPPPLSASGDGRALYLATTFTESWAASAEHSVKGQGLTDIGVARLSPDGTIVWLRNFGGAVAESLDAIAPTRDGGLWVAGSFTGTTEIGGVMLSTTDTDAFLLQIGADGELKGVRHLPSTGVERITALKATDSHLLVGGIFQKSMTLGDETAQSRGKTDIFLMQLRISAPGPGWDEPGSPGPAPATTASPGDHRNRLLSSVPGPLPGHTR